jgi:hypothetical protein
MAFTLSDASVDPELPFPDPDLGEKLYTITLDFFQSMARNSKALGIEDDKGFKEQLGQFYLWGEYFSGGKLSKILESYHDLGLMILKFLVRIAQNLYEGQHFFSY